MTGVCGFSLSTKQKSKKKIQAALVKMYPTVIFVLVNLCVIQVPLQNQHTRPRGSISSLIWTTECEEAVQKQMTRNLLRCILFINGWKTLLYVHSASYSKETEVPFTQVLEDCWNSVALFCSVPGLQRCNGSGVVVNVYLFITLLSSPVGVFVATLPPRTVKETKATFSSECEMGGCSHNFKPSAWPFKDIISNGFCSETHKKCYPKNLGFINIIYSESFF